MNAHVVGARQAATVDRRRLIALGLAPFLGVFAFAALPPFFPAIVADLGGGVPVFGQVVAGMLLLSAGLGLVVGPLADRWGSRRLLIVGALAGATSLLGVGLAPSIPALVVAGLVGGLALAMLPGLSLALARTAFIDHAVQVRAIGLATAATAGASVLGVPVLTAISGGVGWRGAFVVAGVAALLIARLLASWLPEPAPGRSAALRPSRLPAAYRPVIGHRPTRRLLGAAGLRGVSWFGLTTYLGAVLAGEFGLPDRAVGAAYALSGGGYVIGSLVAGHLLARMPARLVVARANAAQAPLIGLALTAALGPVGTIAILPLIGFLGGVGWVALTTAVTADSPAGAGATMTLAGTLASLGAACGGPLSGALLSLGGYPLLGIGLPVFAVMAAVLAWRRDDHS